MLNTSTQVPSIVSPVYHTRSSHELAGPLAKLQIELSPDAVQRNETETLFHTGRTSIAPDSSQVFNRYVPVIVTADVAISNSS